MNLTEQQLVDFSDTVDQIDDELTELCDTTLDSLDEVLQLIEKAGEILKKYGLELAEDDLVSLQDSLEVPASDESEILWMPVYKNQELTEFNLMVSYFMDGSYQVDMEFQYEWESEV